MCDAYLSIALASELKCLILLCICFFFFKQKTAYEMRISDWSSDVCSSDLNADTQGYAKAWGGAGGDGHSLWALLAGLRYPVCPTRGAQIGRASCRERVCQYV